jgi:hypothetical protein
MNTSTASVLLIADDPNDAAPFRDELEASGYQVTQPTSFLDTLNGSPRQHDIVVLCGLAVVAYPGQGGCVVRVREGMTPAALVSEVHRRVALRATLAATIATAA